VPWAWGGDTGGSIRLPAAYTGTVGLKPSQGRIGKSDGGDNTCHGAITTTARDMARLLDVVAGPAATDKNSLEPHRGKYEDLVETLDVRGLRVVWTADLGGHVRCEPEVARIARSAAEALASAAGLTFVDAKLGLSENPVRILRVFSSLNALATARRHGFWPDEAKLRQLSDPLREYLEHGARQTARDYVDALTARQILEAEMAEFFSAHDLLLSPTTPYVAFPAGGPIPAVVGGHEVTAPYLNNFTAWANLTYRPAISIPAGVSSNGLPVGLHIGGLHHREDILLRLAWLFEQIRPWPRCAPMAHEAGSGADAARR
jgi:aspartyl-tRNA(Asn)/glutamyl-tRNA(Gln) amidotransferase subunit A